MKAHDAGVTSPSLSGEEKQGKRYLDNLFSDMASLIPFLEDDGVTDISVPDSGEIIVKKFAKGKIRTGVFVPGEQVKRILFAAATLLEKKIDVISGTPTLEAVIPKYNARITGILPPWTMRAELTLRKPPALIYTLKDYLAEGRMSRDQYAFLIKYIHERKNILIGGATGSGKSTMLNAVLDEMQKATPLDTFYIVEDVPELQCHAAIKTMLCVEPYHARDALKKALRWTPDRIIFGELRDGRVAKTLINAWNTGHTGGATTIHANDCASMIKRIKQLAGKTLSVEEIKDAVNVCIHLKGTKDGPLVDEIKETASGRSITWERKTRG